MQTPIVSKPVFNIETKLWDIKYFNFETSQYDTISFRTRELARDWSRKQGALARLNTKIYCR